MFLAGKEEQDDDSDDREFAFQQVREQLHDK
jgi:hypothetical protein